MNGKNEYQNIKQHNSSKSKLDLNNTDIWMTTTNRASVF